MSPDLDGLSAWIGRTETATDTVREAPLNALAATLDRDDPPLRAGDPVTPGGHWLLCVPVVRQAEIGPDGHPHRGGFLPPVPLPRRMWAGGELVFTHPLRVGSPLTRRSCIEQMQAKDGRSGPLVFVRVRHEWCDEAGMAVLEHQDLVYRDQPAPGAPTPAPTPAPSGAAWTRQVLPDPVLLFRYSALTFNAHRIHYDLPYATQVEGYPGRVVHGPLLATLLLDLLRRQAPGLAPSRFAFRSVAPLFDTRPFLLCGRPDPGTATVALWACDLDGRLAMQAQADVPGLKPCPLLPC